MAFNPETVHQALQEKFRQRVGERAAQAKELSTRVEVRIRESIGNDVLSVPAEQLQQLFPEIREYNEILRLQDIARWSKERRNKD